MAGRGVTAEADDFLQRRRAQSPDDERPSAEGRRRPLSSLLRVQPPAALCSDPPSDSDPTVFPFSDEEESVIAMKMKAHM